MAKSKVMHNKEALLRVGCGGSCMLVIQIENDEIVDIAVRDAEEAGDPQAPHSLGKNGLTFLTEAISEIVGVLRTEYPGVWSKLEISKKVNDE